MLTLTRVIIYITADAVKPEYMEFTAKETDNNYIVDIPKDFGVQEKTRRVSKERVNQLTMDFDSTCNQIFCIGYFNELNKDEVVASAKEQAVAMIKKRQMQLQGQIDKLTDILIQARNK